MPSSFGSTLRVTVFGQSHSPAIGCVVEGLPAGFAVDQEALARFMARRAPGGVAWSTPRKEADAVRIVSGLNPAGTTCGAPLACLIENTNTRSSDYDELRRVPRPGHADFTAQAKWHGAQDVAGGGHFSGRLTAPLCAAGGIALQVLATRGVRVGAHLAEVAGIEDAPFDGGAPTGELLRSQLDSLADGRAFPVLDEGAGKRIREAIEEARSAQDSVGGIVECAAMGMPAGVGSPLFDGIESAIARIAFGVPAVKGLEFGAGFDVARMRGSENNDPYGMDDEGRPTPLKNDAGGNLGGITTGAPVIFRLAFKPTPSIGREQRSVDLKEGKDTTLAVRGRHDPCIAPRAVPVAEAIMALALLDSWLSFPPEQL
ncbi:MAG: chorismate synthase [Atopobiaceae bacterium]|nr:chorismate synthase [Atopobiaceae bacterium]